MEGPLPGLSHIDNYGVYISERNWQITPYNVLRDWLQRVCTDISRMYYKENFHNHPTYRAVKLFSFATLSKGQRSLALLPDGHAIFNYKYYSFHFFILYFLSYSPSHKNNTNKIPARMIVNTTSLPFIFTLPVRTFPFGHVSVHF